MNLKELTVRDVNQYVENCSSYDDLSDQFLGELQNDQRVAIQKIYQKIQRFKENQKTERNRLSNLFKIERSFWEKGLHVIAGVDEAGRGPLAGPVVAAAVVFNKEEYINGLNDSKKISAAKRYLLEQEIIKKALCYHVGIIDNNIIDHRNIREASFDAMKCAVAGLAKKPQFILIDGFEIPQLTYEQLAVVKGDQICASIAAASILAKCTRDRIMLEYHHQYPQYRFDLHKGYGTKIHYDAIKVYGISPIHRKTFLS